MDGATHAQIFFRIMLPLVAPILAVTGAARLHRHDQRVPHRQRLPAPTRRQDPRGRPVRPGRRRQRNTNFGMFCAGHAAHRDPDGAGLPVAAALHRLRAHRRSGQGMSRSARKGGVSVPVDPHHRRLGALHVSRRQTPACLGDRRSTGPGAGRHARDRPASTVRVRRSTSGVPSCDGEPRLQPRRSSTAPTATSVWWRAAVAGAQPGHALPVPARRQRGHRWLHRGRARRPRRPRRRRLQAGQRTPRRRPGPATRSSTRSSPTGSPARPPPTSRRCRTGRVPCDWDAPVVGRGPRRRRQFYGGDLDGITGRLDHLGPLGVDTVYLTPFFPARSNHRYDASTFDAVDPLLGGDAALARLADAVHARGMRLLGDITTQPHRRRARVVHRATPTSAQERELLLLRPARRATTSWLGRAERCRSSTGTAPSCAGAFVDRRDSLRALARQPYGLDGWRVDVANMTGRRGADDLHPRGGAAAARGPCATRGPTRLLVAEHAHDAAGDLDRDGWHGHDELRRLHPAAVDLAARGPTWRCRTSSASPAACRRAAATPCVATMRAFAARHVVAVVTRTRGQLLGSHDTARIRTVVGDAGPAWRWPPGCSPPCRACRWCSPATSSA